MLSSLNFSDLYLGSEKSYSGGSGMNTLLPLPDNSKAEALELRSLCVERHGATANKEFSIRHNETTYRVSLLDSMDDQVFVLRRFPNSAPTLEELKLHSVFVNRFLKPELKGLMLVVGAYASGKTTTASAILKGRLQSLGGVGVTIEDPVEMPLEGEYTKGVCYQTWAQDGNFSPYVKSAARWAPSMMFLGEIRDGATALEALKASINGIFVIATFHASSIETALQRFHALAAGQDSAYAEDVANLLSTGLIGVVHQNLIGDADKRLEANMLWITEKDHTIRTLIREKRWQNLNEIVHFQRNELVMESACI